MTRSRRQRGASPAEQEHAQCLRKGAGSPDRVLTERTLVANGNGRRVPLEGKGRGISVPERHPTCPEVRRHHLALTQKSRGPCAGGRGQWVTSPRRKCV